MAHKKPSRKQRLLTVYHQLVPLLTDLGMVRKELRGLRKLHGTKRELREAQAAIYQTLRKLDKVIQ